jgi:NADH-quinone oxidoreductase subunit C
VQVCDFALKGIHLEATIRPDAIVEAAKIMDRHGFAIDAVTGMDWLAQGLLEVVYDFLHFQSGMRVALRARLPRTEPRIATISDIFQGANWHERETHDMFGIVFIGHPDLTPFLLPDDADYHPLLKDFQS